MFIISLTYIADLTEIDQYVDAHMAYLQSHYDSGSFLMSGRKEPRVGGVILATAENLAAITDIAESDPFVQHGVARYDIIEFHATMTSEALAQLRETPTS